jgi:hypothetical protein
MERGLNGIVAGRKLVFVDDLIYGAGDRDRTGDIQLGKLAVN